MDWTSKRTLLEAQRAALISRARRGETSGLALSAAMPDGDTQLPEEFDATEHKALLQIEAALSRIVDGSYGYCVICGGMISEARLGEFAASPFCASCSV